MDCKKDQLIIYRADGPDIRRLCTFQIRYKYENVD